jgi:class 3 adenylate cyclase
MITTRSEVKLRELRAVARHGTEKEVTVSDVSYLDDWRSGERTEPDVAAELAGVLDEHLNVAPPRVRTLRSIERNLATLPSVPGSPGAEEEIDPSVAALLRSIGLEPRATALLAREVAAVIDAGSASGIAHDALPSVLQAYARGVGRIVAAEASLLGGAIRATSPADRADQLDRALKALVPAATRGFELMHSALLRETVRNELAEETFLAGEPDSLTVAMVDLVGSTSYLKRSGPAELEQLADVLFEAAQSASAGRGANVVKYVGDGVFLTGRDTVDMAEVALELVALLESELPLRARGGLSHGPVVQRAGDIFGLPVNTAQILSKAACPSSVVADETAAVRLPRGLRAHPRSVTLPHPAFGKTSLVTVRIT